jgi:phage-related tail fiber protein
MAVLAKISARQLLLLDLNLEKVNNWGASSAVNDPSDLTYATAGAVKKAYDLAKAALPATSNAVSASKLLTARTISLTGDATGNGNFDGSANLSIALDLKASGVAAGTYRSVTVDARGIVTGGTNPTTLAGYGITDALGIKDNAVSASKLATARTIALTGDATGNATFDGSANLSIALTAKDTGVVAGTYSSVTVDSKGRVTAGAALASADLPASGVTAGTYRSVTVDSKGIVTGGTNPTTLAGYGITDALGIKDNAVSASKLATARTITFTGDATGSGTFDGSGNLSIALTGRSTGVAAGTYRSVTVDVRGDVTAGSNPTTLAGYGITDAAPIAHVSAGGNAHAAATTTLAGFMSAADKAKLDGIASSATNYTHPSGDGNLHVPATGNNNSGKVLRAGATAGSLSWATLTPADVGALPDSGGGIKGNFWRESGGKQYALTAHLGWTAEAKPNLILLARKYVTTFVAKTGFIGRILFDRGSNTANMRTDYVDVNVSCAYQTNRAEILYRTGISLDDARIVEVTYNSEVYYALYRPSVTTSNSEVIVDGHSFGGGLPLLIPDATAYTVTDVVTTDSLYHVNNKPTSSDVGLGNLDNARQMRATLTNGYWGLTDAAGSSSAYIRTTSSGIIPYQSGSSSALGTSTWQFNSAYVKTFYEDGASLVTKYLGISDNAVSATKLATARTLTIGNTGKTFDGSANVSWTLDELGALPIKGGALTGAISLPGGRSLRIVATTTNPAAVVSSEGGYAMLWRDPTADEAAAGKSMEFVGINRSSQLIFRQDKGNGDGKYSDQIVYHTGNKPSASDVGALPAVGGNPTGNVYVDKGASAEPNIGVKRDVRLLYLYDSGSHHGLYSTGLSGKVNASLIRRVVATGDIDIGSTMDAGGVVTMYGDPRSAVAQGTNAASLVRKDYADAQFVSGTGGTGVGNNPLLETTTGGVRDFNLAKTNGTFTVANGWLNGISNVGATSVGHSGIVEVFQRAFDNQTTQVFTGTASVDGVRVSNSSSRTWVSAAEDWGPWIKCGIYESVNMYRAGILRLNAEGANGPDGNYPFYTLTKEKFRTDTTSYYGIGELGFRVNAANRYDPHTADLMVRVTAQVKPSGDEHDGRMYLAARRRDAAGGIADVSVLALDRDSGAVFTHSSKSVSIKAGVINAIDAYLTGSLTLGGKLQHSLYPGANKQLLNVNTNGQVYLGNPEAASVDIETVDGMARVKVAGGTGYRIYHENFKPTASDVGAAPDGYGLGGYGKIISTVTGNTDLRRQSGFFQGSNVNGLPVGNAWAYVFSQAHNNTNGYFGYLAINFNGSSAWIGGQEAGNQKGPFAVVLDNSPNTYNSIKMSNWFRSTGDTGWFNETYGGGFHMTDSLYVRVYNNKRIHVPSTADDAINVAGGIWMGGLLQAANMRLAGAAWINGGQPVEDNALTRKDYVDNKTWAAWQGNQDVITGGWAQVGSYLMCAVHTNAGIPGLNNLISGAYLVPSGAGKKSYEGSGSIPGTWRQMGALGSANTDSEWDDRTTLFFRVA